MTTRKPTNDDDAQPQAGGKAGPKKDATGNWAEQIRKIANAAVGAVSLSADDVKGFVEKLVEKGEIAQKEGRKIFKDLSERLKKTVKEPKEAAREARETAIEAEEKIAARINGAIEKILHRMNIATRRDVEDLAVKLDGLDRKLEELVDSATTPAGAR